jgi:hypothetical protein
MVFCHYCVQLRHCCVITLDLPVTFWWRCRVTSDYTLWFDFVVVSSRLPEFLLLLPLALVTSSDIIDTTRIIV